MAIRSAQKFPQWEYEIRLSQGRWAFTTLPTIKAILNEAGAAGWELAAVNGSLGYFKKLKRLVERTDGD